jgi:SecD/SecF fusion protein
MEASLSRATALRLLLALAVLGGSAYFIVNKPARLGLDLRGGSQIVLETRDSATTKANRETTDRTLEVLRRRVDALGVAEPTLARSGDNRIIIELPGVQDPQEAAEVVGRTAELTFHPVLGVAPPEEPTPTPTASGTPTPAPTPSGTPTPTPTPSAAPPPKDRELVLEDDSGQRLQLGPAALSGQGVENAEAVLDTQGGRGWVVNIDFRGSGDRAWVELTGKAACAQLGDPQRRVAIVLDDKIITSPEVVAEVACNVGMTGGSTQITGNFSRKEAQELALLVKAGALPVPVEKVSQRTVGPSLGAEAIDASAKAAIIGVILTGLFIIFVYRLVGALAVVALVAYAGMSYAALVALGATLTLPGLAGFVLAIGMAVDANVLVFERAREEFAGPAKSLRSAVTGGFQNAFSAIADSNVTTLLAAVLLFFLASGPVRGFGVTLSIGVIASMVSALFITRLLVEGLASWGWVQRRPGITGLAHLGRIRTWLTERGPDLMRWRRRWIGISLVLVVLALAGLGFRGLNFGVELTGGRLIQYSTSQQVDVDDARTAISGAGFPTAVVQESGDNDLTVRAGNLDDDGEKKIRAALAGIGGDVERVNDEQIGPSLGSELRTKALIALAVALLAQLIYLAVRFKWIFGASAVLAMAHDVLILIGVFAWLGKPIDGVFLAALLTVIGYSVNDSVVVFDRIREMWRGHARKIPFAKISNTAVLQTVPRTINTGLGAVFILATLAILGGSSLTDFAIALLVGIAIGTYSSMFLATPLAIEFQARAGTTPSQFGAKPSARKRAPARSGTGAVV